jgi:small subunit ribosomal protein S2
VVETPIVEEAAPVVAESTPEVVATPVEETPVAEATASSEGSDDLTLVEGIGPKIAELCHAKGITTFAQLAATSEDDLKAMLTEGGSSFASKNPGTWAKQAQLAAEGKMDELKAWQDEMKGGLA